MLVGGLYWQTREHFVLNVDLLEKQKKWESVRNWVSLMRSKIVVTILQWSKEGTAVKQRYGHGWPRVTDACGERRLSCVVQFNRRITVGQIANRFSVSSDGKVDACPDPVLSLKMPTMGVWTSEPGNERKWPGLMNHVDGRVRVRPGNRMHTEAVWSFGQCSAR